MNKITIYSKPNCMACNFSKKYLEDKGIEFKEINVFEDDKALAMLRDKGFSEMPVIDVNGEFHTGFQPNILAKVEDKNV